MINGVKLPKYKSISKTKRIGFYNKPKYVYVPLVSGKDTDITIIVKKGDYVYKGSVIGRRKGDYKISICSSISGTVIDYVQRTISTGEKAKCVVIENDFKEKEEIKEVVNKKINQYTKEEFLKTLKDCGVVGMGGNEFPTYLKYKTNEKINTLIVNCTECSAYSTSDYVLLQERSEEILETIDSILEINEIENAVIAVKKSDTELINLLNSFIGTYLKVKIVTVPDCYPIGWEKNLVKYVCKKTYNVNPIEVGIVVNNVSTIYAIFEALKYHKSLCERIITFTGNGIKRPQNVYVKIGTPLYEIINKIGTNIKEPKIVIGEPMMGNYVKEEDIVATIDTNCVIVLNEIPKEIEEECIRCGKCTKYCPAKISPVLIKDNKNNKEKLKKLHPEKCIKCGLCSYICPSNIKLRDIIEKVCEK